MGWGSDGRRGGWPAPGASQSFRAQGEIPDLAREDGCLCISGFSGHSVPWGPVGFASSEGHGLGWAWEMPMVPVWGPPLEEWGQSPPVRAGSSSAGWSRRDFWAQIGRRSPGGLGGCLWRPWGTLNNLP